MEELVLDHPLIFRDYQKRSIDFDQFPFCYREGEYYRDNWGCLWYNVQGGLAGRVVEHPLAHWKTLDTHEMPDLLSKSERGERDWEKFSLQMRKIIDKNSLLIQNSRTWSSND